MKKLIILLTIFFSATQCMYHSVGTKRKLPYDTVKLINRAPIPFELTWVEISPEGQQIKISYRIDPGQEITVKLGVVGGYSTRNPAKVIYKPIPNDNEFNYEFIIDLPSSKEFAFTAVKLADILNNIWIPGVFKLDEKENFRSFQYMNMQHPTQWEKVMLNAGKVKIIK